VTPTAESVSVPYSNPMFDVPDVSRFYRCPITDVHIGRSLTERLEYRKISSIICTRVWYATPVFSVAVLQKFIIICIIRSQSFTAVVTTHLPQSA